MSSKIHVLRLYRRSLKLALDWSVHRYLWRGQALYIRELFEAKRHVKEPRQMRELITETEALLEKWKHPDPYRPPTAPGGSSPAPGYFSGPAAESLICSPEDDLVDAAIA
ncbi:hypothetical protein GMOD_00000678 [Pyrenophora seminiperda CCB06]|uniref:NADH dehydrogenase [ubiquinone] 1 beta subcomplex subunit 9 n=1 Tax=Pyrenophora seminiperda CCB06 TaxID=1302712 RepID=A0A3M7M854_9PLEO|nr:hypothetical protein GMOD_00000678 [Pyrenophora seminiperda CCB06]